MRHKILSIFFWALPFLSDAQTYRGQSLSGADAMFASNKNRIFHLPFNVGGFVVQNWAIGVAGNYTSSLGTTGSMISSKRMGGCWSIL
jgi:hypothetical protein